MFKTAARNKQSGAEVTKILMEKVGNASQLAFADGVMIIQSENEVCGDKLIWALLTPYSVFKLGSVTKEAAAIPRGYSRPTIEIHLSKLKTDTLQKVAEFASKSDNLSSSEKFRVLCLLGNAFEDRLRADHNKTLDVKTYVARLFRRGLHSLFEPVFKSSRSRHGADHPDILLAMYELTRHYGYNGDETVDTDGLPAGTSTVNLTHWHQISIVYLNLSITVQKDL